MHAIESAHRIGFKSGEEWIEVFLRRPMLGDQLKRLTLGLIGTEASDQDFGDLSPGDDAIAGIARLASISLQQD